jgi:hypothetical protein
MNDYGKPQIADYGDLQELTAACLGSGSDLGKFSAVIGSEEAEYFSGYICETHPK